MMVTQGNFAEMIIGILLSEKLKWTQHQVELQVITNTLGEDFRSLTNMNSRENSERTAATVRMIKSSLNS